MSATAGARLGIQVGTILGSIAIALGGLIHLASTARLGDSAGAGEAFMPAIIVRGTIHGMARLGAGVEAIGDTRIMAAVTGPITEETYITIIEDQLMRMTDVVRAHPEGLLMYPTDNQRVAEPVPISRATHREG